MTKKIYIPAPWRRVMGVLNRIFYVTSPAPEVGAWASRVVLTWIRFSVRKRKSNLFRFSRFTSLIKILIIGLSFLATWAQAAGIAVSPSQLFFKLTVGQSQEKFLIVENLSAEPVIYNLYSDEFAGQITLAPDSFRLEPGEKQKIKVSPLFKQAGLWSTNLSIVAQELDRRKFNVATGVKVPLSIKTNPSVKAGHWLSGGFSALVILLLSTLALVIIVMVDRRRRHWYQRLTGTVNLLHKKSWLYKLFK